MVAGDDNEAGGAAARFAVVMAAFEGRPNVSAPDLGSRSSAFGATALKVGGKIFAMLVGGELVVKLPGERVKALVESGVGSPFGTGGRVMREWVSIPHDGMADWHAVAEEACTFVESRR
jgi:hypothetical protein